MGKPTPSNLTQERLKQLLHYDPETGEFSRVAKGRGYHKPVNSLYEDGYYRIGVDRRIYMANRLAWLYMTGKWPKEIIDHRDLDKSNNIYGGSINGTGAAGELRRWVYGAGKANASAHGRNLPSVGATLIFLFGPQL